MRWKKIAKLSAALTAVLFAGLFAAPAYRWGKIELERRAEAPDPVVATMDELAPFWLTCWRITRMRAFLLLHRRLKIRHARTVRAR